MLYLSSLTHTLIARAGVGDKNSRVEPRELVRERRVVERLGLVAAAAVKVGAAEGARGPRRRHSPRGPGRSERGHQAGQHPLTLTLVNCPPSKTPS